MLLDLTYAMPCQWIHALSTCDTTLKFFKTAQPTSKISTAGWIWIRKKMDTIETELEKAKHIIYRAVFYNGKTTESYATKLRV